MARFPKVPGAGPKGMNNPVYWTRMYLQNERYKAKSRSAATKRSNAPKGVAVIQERWDRLSKIYDSVNHEFAFVLVKDLKGKEKDDYLTLMAYTQLFYRNLSASLPKVKKSDLSLFAISMKNLVLKSLEICESHDGFEEIESYEFDGISRVFINGEEKYDFS